MAEQKALRSAQLSQWRVLLLLIIVFGSLGWLLSWQPFGQDLAYHRFADSRRLLGIPHFWNVVSNLPFLAVGLVGLRWCQRQRGLLLLAAWQVFFAGVALVGVGSAYYHAAPDNASLVWDRLPMTVGFMGLVIALLAEQVSLRVGRWLLWPAVLIGVASVVYWYVANDLRLYYWVQLAPMLMIVAVLLLFPARYSHRWLLLPALLFYLLAKYAEYHDAECYARIGLFSGHTLKHLLAAISCGMVLWQLQLRRPV